MKKYLYSTLMATVCLTLSAFTSCDGDDEVHVTPAKSVTEVHGKYTGVMTYGNTTGIKTEVTVDSVTKKISIDSFPVNEIVRAVVAKEDQDTALKYLVYPKCELAYTPSLDKNYIKMVLGQATVSFDVRLKNSKTSKIILNLADKGEGVYEATSHQLLLQTIVNSIKVDENTVKNYKPTKYLYSQARKK